MSAFTYSEKNLKFDNEGNLLDILSKPVTADYKEVPSDQEIINTTKSSFRNNKEYLYFLNKKLEFIATHNWNDEDIKDFSKNIDKDPAVDNVYLSLSENYNLVFCKTFIGDLIRNTLVNLIFDYAKEYIVSYYTSERYF